jgi:hypothetical protein
MASLQVNLTKRVQTPDGMRNSGGIALHHVQDVRTVCDLYPAAEEYANSPTSEGKMELCAAPSARNSYW